MEGYEYVKKTDSEEELVEIARKRIKIKRELYTHIAAYILVNLFLIFIYLITTGFDFKQYFWPMWVLAGWGLGLLFHIFEAIQELNFKYNVKAVNKELAKIKKKLDIEDY